MDPEMWVPCSLVAGFRQIQSRTTNIQLVVDVLRACDNVEVNKDGSMARPKNYLFLLQPAGTLVVEGALPADTPVELIEGLFPDDLKPKAIKADALGKWFATFDSPEGATYRPSCGLMHSFESVACGSH